MSDMPVSFTGASPDDRSNSHSGTGAGRYAPSPTGELHLGNLRTGLLAWLFARSTGRRFLLRIEDLDAARVRPGMAEQQLADLAALGITFDGEPVVQSQRLTAYQQAMLKLADRTTNASAVAGRSQRPRRRRTAAWPDIQAHAGI
jgi:glutamyl/glutaminyl-tRNA synthetase